MPFLPNYYDRNTFSFSFFSFYSFHDIVWSLEEYMMDLCDFLCIEFTVSNCGLVLPLSSNIKK